MREPVAAPRNPRRDRANAFRAGLVCIGIRRTGSVPQDAISGTNTLIFNNLLGELDVVSKLHLLLFSLASDREGRQTQPWLDSGLMDRERDTVNRFFHKMIVIAKT